jgi:hypothetical protein
MEERFEQKYKKVKEKYKKVKNNLKDLKKENKNEKEKLNEMIKKMETQIMKFKSGLSCTICLNYYCLPQTLKCGHSFCFLCIREWILNFKDKTSIPVCPICREIIKSYPFKNYSLLQQIENIIVGIDLEDYEKQKKHAVIIYESQNNNNNVWKPLISQELIKDEEEEIDRCPNCFWEIDASSGCCEGCGKQYQFSKTLNSSSDSSDFIECEEGINSDDSDDTSSSIRDFIVDDDESTNDFESDLDENIMSDTDFVDENVSRKKRKFIIGSESE